MADSFPTRFPVIPDEHIEQLVDRRLSQNTKRVIDNSVAIFSAYAHARNTSLGDIYQLPKSEVDKHLQRFFTEARKKDGSAYTHSGLASLRYGLQKHFLKECRYDIINDAEFRPSGEVFSAVLVDMKKQGKGFVQHMQEMSTEDLNKLYTCSALSVSDPVSLQNKVFVDVFVYLCNCGRDNLRDMKKSDFHVRTDAAGDRYVSLSSRFAKLRKIHLGRTGDTACRERRMYHVPGSPTCPVTSFEKYVSKLNSELDDFWQKPAARQVAEEDLCWYESVPVGRNMLSSKMKTLSVDAKLSAVYTNHCLRASCAATLRTVSESKTSCGQYLRIVPDSLQQKRDDILVIAEWMPATS